MTVVRSKLFNNLYMKYITRLSRFFLPTNEGPAKHSYLWETTTRLWSPVCRVKVNDFIASYSIATWFIKECYCFGILICCTVNIITVRMRHESSSYKNARVVRSYLLLVEQLMKWRISSALGSMGCFEWPSSRGKSATC